MIFLFARQFESGEVPAHGAVLERHHTVGNARVDQGLRAYDAARAARAVDDHQRIGRRDEVVHAVDEFSTRTIDAARDAHLGVFRERTAVEDDDFFAGIDAGLDFLRRHTRRIFVVLDEFTESLARHVDAAVDLVTFGCPRINAAFQHHYAGVAMAGKYRCRALREPFVGIADHHTGCAPGHQQGHAQFQA